MIFVERKKVYWRRTAEHLALTVQLRMTVALPNKVIYRFEKGVDNVVMSDSQVAAIEPSFSMSKSVRRIFFLEGEVSTQNLPFNLDIP